MHILELYSSKTSFNHISASEIWDSSSAVLITYPDAVSKPEEPSLNALAELIDLKIGNLVSVIHVLPFLRSTSDGGFALCSHEELEPSYGNWDHLKLLSKNHLLMADLVLNHVSASHPWVEQFRKAEEPGRTYILSRSNKEGWDQVFRPRNSPLFSTIATVEGPKKIWTTFSPDQIDLNWRNPFLILEFLRLIIKYIDNGVKWIRLDAVGFIWKEAGTTCIHRKQVHLIVKLLRIILQEITPDSVLLTETNVPQKDNLSYLEFGEEANIAYNFPLPPLLLEAIISNKVDLLNKWINAWPNLPTKTTLLNFTASHDGVGLKPLHGLMSVERLHNLLIECEKRGGFVSHRTLPNGVEEPYEINISWWSAMRDDKNQLGNCQSDCFVLSQLLVMALPGVPAFYLQALLGSGNDLNSFKQTGQRRDLNREKFRMETLLSNLNDSNSPVNKNLSHLKKAMTIRSNLKAFHPEAPMTCLSKDRNDLIILRRGHEHEYVWAVHNFTANNVLLTLSELIPNRFNLTLSKWHDLLMGTQTDGKTISIRPYSVQWLQPI